MKDACNNIGIEGKFLAVSFILLQYMREASGARLLLSAESTNRSLANPQSGFLIHTVQIGREGFGSQTAAGLLASTENTPSQSQT